MQTEGLIYKPTYLELVIWNVQSNLPNDFTQ